MDNEVINKKQKEARKQITKKEERRIGRPKGAKNKNSSRYWSKEGKYEYVRLIISREISLSQSAKENNISAEMLSKWVKRYQESGIES